MKRDDATATPEVPSTSRLCEAWVGGVLAQHRVVEEVPVALVYNGVSHAVMLASPADLENFALGFSITEGIVGGPSDVRDIDVVASADGIAVQLTIAAACMAALKDRRRALAGRTGCGLCGVETLRDAVRPVRVVACGDALAASMLDRRAIDRAFRALGAQQHLHRSTGAAHAAGFAQWNGALVLMREDVGRHNALDKLVGAMAVAPHRDAAVDPSSGFVVVTSRASYEMVHKTAAAGVGLIAALAAPTTLAIRTAERAGVTLVGCAARSLPHVYSHPQRLTGAPHP